MRELLRAAREAALLGGRIVARASARGRVPTLKGATDLVTATDRASERAIQRFLEKRFPDHGFIGEEGGRRAGAVYRWVVDPLDGTMNFAHGMPWHGVSVAVERGGRVLAGAIYDSGFGHLYSAAKGLGSWRHGPLDSLRSPGTGKRLRVSRRAPLRNCLLATGFASALLDRGRATDRDVRAQFARFERFCRAARGVRRPGAAALDLAYVAAGIFDGFWEARLHAWDIAAGVVIVEEAGGRVTGFDGEGLDLYGGEIVASNGRIHAAMLRVTAGRGSSRR